MKEKMLIVGITMPAAGTERAFLRYAASLSPETTDVTLLLAEKEGALLPQIPPFVRVAEMGAGAGLFSLRRDNAVRVLVKELFLPHPLRALGAVRFLPGLLFGKNQHLAAERLWVYAMKICMPPLPETYDTAVAFWGDHTMFYTAEKVRAAKKIAWLHFEYDYPERDDTLYGKAFEAFDEIVTVSERTKRMLAEKFPSVADRLTCHPNAVDAAEVRRLSELPAEPVFTSDRINLLTVGRIHPVKGYDIALPAVLHLLAEGVPLRWTLIGGTGDSAYEKALRKQIDEAGAGEAVVFLGEKENPFPYIKGCDLYLQPSRSESGALAVMEALALDRPVLCTDFEAAASLPESGKIRVCPKNSAAVETEIRLFIRENSWPKSGKNQTAQELS